MTFSKRMGIKPEQKSLQLEDMDSELRIDLYNTLSLYEELVHQDLKTKGKNSEGHLHYQYRRIWIELFCFDIDRTNYYSHLRDYVKKQYISIPWNEVYDYIEFYYSIFGINKKQLMIDINKTLEKHNSAYRLVKGCITPITDETELKELSESTNTPYDAVNQHLKSALEIFSSRETKDYRNTIKEAISAVEAMANIINGTEGKTLSDAIKRISEKIPIHKSLEDALIKIYGYTSDKHSGIRHYLTEDAKNEPDFADAKFMLVTCSAFVNYLIIKANQ